LIPTPKKQNHRLLKQPQIGNTNSEAKQKSISQINRIFKIEKKEE